MTMYSNPVLSNKVHTLRELFIYQLNDIYDAELLLTDALPRMADSAFSIDLGAMLRRYLRESERKVERLESIFAELREEPEVQFHSAMKGLIPEFDEIIDPEADDSVKDVALIAAAHRIKHYGMAGYRMAVAYALRLDLPMIAAILQQTLEEEIIADGALMTISEKTAHPHSVASLFAEVSS
jgi:ferritin-like metal-binding protein YciE